MCSRWRSPWPSRIRCSATRLRKRGSWPFQEIPVVGADEVVAAAGDRDADVRRGLGEVLLVVQADRLDTAHGVDPPSRLGTAVEIGEFGRDGVDDGGIAFPLGQEPAEHPFLGKFLHPDGVLDDPPVSTERKPARSILGYGFDAEVGLRGEPPVQTDLLFAVEFPFFEAREIEKTEIDGLLHLVDFVSDDEDEGDVRLDDIDPLRSDGGRIRVGSLRQKVRGVSWLSLR